MFTPPVLIGIALAPAIVALGRFSGLDRDRALYPVTLIVIAAYYVLFATMAGAQALPSELIAATVFVVVAIVGYNAACLRLLDQGGDPAEIRGAMEKCRAQAVRAGGILHQLRELTRRRTPEFVQTRQETPLGIGLAAAAQ
mgnify:CR=1 FL=1